MPSFAE